MPHDYSLRTKRFVGVSRLAVREQINKLTDHVAKEAARLAKNYKAGGSLLEFETEMRTLLKSAHIIAASVGKGGRARMLQRDWGRVGAKIKWQYGYLSKFARKIERGAVSDLATVSRARSYASSIYISFARTFQESQTEFVAEGKNPAKARLITNAAESCVECASDESEGWMSVDDFKELGTRICGDFCRCDIEFSEDGEPV